MLLQVEPPRLPPASGRSPGTAARTPARSDGTSPCWPMSRRMKSRREGAASSSPPSLSSHERYNSLQAPHPPTRFDKLYISRRTVAPVYGLPLPRGRLGVSQRNSEVGPCVCHGACARMGLAPGGAQDLGRLRGETLEAVLWEKQEGTSPRGYAKPYQDKGLRLHPWHAKVAGTVPNRKQAGR